MPSKRMRLEQYGNVMAGNEAEGAGLLDAYVMRADTHARLAWISESEGAA